MQDQWPAVVDNNQEEEELTKRSGWNSWGWGPSGKRSDPNLPTILTAFSHLRHINPISPGPNYAAVGMSSSDPCGYQMRYRTPPSTQQQQAGNPFYSS